MIKTLIQGDTVDEDEKKISNSVMVKKPTNIALSMKFLKTFANHTLSSSVVIEMQEELPLMVQYNFDNDLGYLRFYLAPKGDDDQNNE